MVLKLFLILKITLFTLAFQNCEQVLSNNSKPGASAIDEGPYGYNQVIGVVGEPQILRYADWIEDFTYYEKDIETILLRYDGPLVEAYLEKGFYEINRQRRCSLPAEVQESMLANLRGAEICTYRIDYERHPDTVSCMAIAVADVKIVDEEQSHFLRPPMCSYSEFLCDGSSDELRDLLKSLAKESFEPSCTDLTSL